MNCKNCGSIIPDGEGFCPTCGMKVTEEKPKAKKVWLKVLCAVLAVVLVLTSAILIFKDNFTGIVMAMMPAEKQLQYAYAKATEKMSSSVAEDYGEVLENFAEPVSGDLSLEVEASDMLLNTLGITQIGVKRIGINISSAMEGTDKTGMVIDLTVGDTTIASANIYIDYSDMTMVAELPGITGGALKLNLTEDMSAEEAKQMSDYYKMLGSDEIKAFLPDENLVETILPKLVKAAFLEIDDVKVEKTEYTAGGVDAKATGLQVTLTEQDLAKMAIAVLETVKSDEDVKAYVYKLVDALNTVESIADEVPEADEAYTQMSEAIDDAIEEMNALESNTEIAAVNTWVDSNFDILAIEATAKQAGEIFIGKATDGNDVGYELRVDDTDSTVFEISGSGTEKKDILNAELDVVYNDIKLIGLEIKDLDTSALDEGYLNGKFKVSLGTQLDNMIKSELGVGGFGLNIICEGADNKASFTLALTMQESELVSLGIDTSAKMGDATVEIPTDVTEDPESWLQGADISVIFDRLKQAGVPSEYVDMLENSYSY